MAKIPDIKTLRKQIAKKNPESEDIYFRKFLRPLGSYFVKAILYTPLQANHLTLIMIASGLLSAWLFAKGDFLPVLFGAIIFWIIHVLDTIDGSIARYYKKSSFRGKYLDEIFHGLVQPVILVGVGIGAFMQSGSLTALVLGFITALLFSTTESLRLNYQLIMVADLKKDFYKLSSTGTNTKKELSKKQNEKLVTLALLVFNATTLNIMVYVLLFCALIYRLDVAAWFYGILIPMRYVVLAPYYFRKIE